MSAQPRNASNGSIWSKQIGETFRFERVRHDYDDRAVPADMLEQITAAVAAKKVTVCPPAAYASQFGQTISSTHGTGGRSWRRAGR
ncbi:hypothetical protein [Azospirillum canadense]|uniref:hypothetical protein n=1 Tax=Azospirillum canadense TaxID=403962 RepID=UPI00222646C8|nr:hypothetical protein [Azospirillum canadense]MCW2242198.1 midasin (ATPase involved in ribosome maturation) [Azospirillum canadense]